MIDGRFQALGVLDETLIFSPQRTQRSIHSNDLRERTQQYSATSAFSAVKLLFLWSANECQWTHYSNVLH